MSNPSLSHSTLLCGLSGSCVMICRQIRPMDVKNEDEPDGSEGHGSWFMSTETGLMLVAYCTGGWSWCYYKSATYQLSPPLLPMLIPSSVKPRHHFQQPTVPSLFQKPFSCLSIIVSDLPTTSMWYPWPWHRVERYNSLSRSSVGEMEPGEQWPRTLSMSH